MLADGILLTDHYQLTMAQLYFRSGLHERAALFEHFFRSYPDYGTHQAGYAVSAGMGLLVGWLRDSRFDQEALDALREIEDDGGRQVFASDFLDWLASAGDLTAVSLSAVPEGRVVHPNTPIAVAEGPLALAQILETPLLNHLNFSTLIATKTSRVVDAAHGGSVLEFGARRAPGRGAGAATRASLIGGAAGSSNVGASLDMGRTPQGTHAHSMVQVFMAIAGGELEAFRAYADVYPDGCLLLVDTIDTLESGVPNAITVFEELRKKGHRPLGIRLDSGDLAHLAVRARAMLDEAGFEEAAIVLSSQLDEVNIFQIRSQIVDEAPRYGVDVERLLKGLMYGVGSRMVTSEGDSSLDGVYKAVAVADESGEWTPAIKISDSPAKTQTPGAKELWRIYDERGRATADVLAVRDEDLSGRALDLIHPTLPGVRRRLEPDEISRVERLLEPVDLRDEASPADLVTAARARRDADLELLDPGVRRLVNPHTYHVSLTPDLAELKRSLVSSFHE